MYIRQAVILEETAEKLWRKHHVEEHEVDQVFQNRLFIASLKMETLQAKICMARLVKPRRDVISACFSSIN